MKLPFNNSFLGYILLLYKLSCGTLLLKVILETLNKPRGCHSRMCKLLNGKFHAVLFSLLNKVVLTFTFLVEVIPIVCDH